MDIQDAIHHVLDGRAILFTGAGFSYGASRAENEPIPSSRILANKLLTEIGYTNSDGQLDKAAGAYLRRKTKRELVDLLIKQFTVINVSKSHEILASLPWHRVYTTNYDMVFEEAGRKANKICTCVEGSDQPRQQLAKPNLVVHINGAISRLTEDSLDSSFKLISQSYASDSFEKSGWAFHFRNDIRAASVIIFIGYSMYDLDVRRVLFSEDISEKCFFVIAPITLDNELDAEDLSDLGVVAPIGIDAFARNVADIQASYIPKEPELLLEKWEITKPISSAVAAPTDRDVLDFLTIGKLNDSLLFEAFGSNKGDYVIERSLLAALDAGLAKKDACVLVIGDLGTGKTFVYDSLAQIFLSRGWSVFKLDGSSDNEISETEEICAISGNKLLVIENYQRHMDLLKWLSETKPKDTTIAIAARTSVHELFSDDLYRLFGDNLRIHDVSSFTKPEIDNAIRIFDRYGLWGERISWSYERKQKFINYDCRGYLPSLLADVLKSTHITERYSSLLSESHNRGDIEQLLICAFSLEVMGFTPRMSYIQELLSNRVHWAGLRSKSVELSAIVNFSSNTIQAKSSVLAKHLLNHIFSAKKIVETLIGMTREAEDRRSDADYREIFNSLMRYRNLSLFLPEENRLASTVNFYEGVKNLPTARRNPQFWLQYAIACMAFGELDRAQRYFKDAYSFVSEGYNTFQIDNHYARLLLEKALIASSSKDALLLIDEAKKIIFQQMNSEVRYYPYRVALGLFKCYERFLDSWSPNEAIYFMRIFQEVKVRCEKIKGNLRQNRYIVDCLSKATRVLENKPE